MQQVQPSSSACCKGMVFPQIPSDEGEPDEMAIINIILGMYLESVEGLHASLCLVRNHPSNSMEEHATWSTEMERPTLGIHITTQFQVLEEFHWRRERESTLTHQ